MLHPTTPDYNALFFSHTHIFLLILVLYFGFSIACSVCTLNNYNKFIQIVNRLILSCKLLYLIDLFSDKPFVIKTKKLPVLLKNSALSRAVCIC